MPELSTNGIAVHYEIEGPSDGPVVTMSHSLSANTEMWTPQVSALVAAGFRVLRYDTRGHGRSAVPEGPYTLDMLAEDVAGLLGSLDIPRTHFVGLSMGGMIGQTFALKHPSRLSSLTLCDTSSGYPPEAAAMWNDRIVAAERDGLASGVNGTIDRWFSPGFVAGNPTTIDAVRHMIRNTPVRGYVGCCHAISKLNVTPRLGQIKAPTLIVVGEDDPGTPVAMSRIMHEGIPGSELVILPVARHLANMEAVDDFNRALIAFLKKH